LETGDFIIYGAALGLLLLFAWLMFRVARYKARSREIDQRVKEISQMSSPRPLKKARHASDKKVMEAPNAGLMVIMHKDGTSPARDMFVNAISKGRTGLIVTTDDPNEIPLDPGIRRIWLNRSTRKMRSENVVVVNPTNLSGVLDEITLTLEGRPSTVLLDNFEDVIGANDIQRVVRFLDMLRELSAKEKVSFLVPIGYRTIPQRVRNQIMEAFETVVV
jgi:hypothetical protein